LTQAIDQITREAMSGDEKVRNRDKWYNCERK
jgi:hypothetical protein